jgi:MFS family permease
MLRAVQPDADRVHRQRWAILALLCTSLLIVVIGNTTLNVTLPVLSDELGATESQLQWVVAIYSLVFAGLLFTTGALGDRFGRKGALQLGLVILLVGSSLAAFSSSMSQLIACRAVMGVGDCPCTASEDEPVAAGGVDQPLPVLPGSGDGEFVVAEHGVVLAVVGATIVRS